MKYINSNIRYFIGILIGLSMSFIMVKASNYFFDSNETGYNNEETNLTATNVQDAIDEIYNENIYTVQFNGNGATSGNMSQMKCAIGKDCVLPDNNYIKTGYKFIGWSHTSEGPVAYDNQASIVLINPESITTLYARWQLDKGTLLVKNYTSDVNVLSSDINTDFTYKLKVINNPNGFTDMSYTLKDLPNDYVATPTNVNYLTTTVEDYEVKKVIDIDIPIIPDLPDVPEPRAAGFDFVNNTNGKRIYDVENGYGIYARTCSFGYNLEQCEDEYYNIDKDYGTHNSTWNFLYNECLYISNNYDGYTYDVYKYWPNAADALGDYNGGYIAFKLVGEYNSDPNNYLLERDDKYTAVNDVIISNKTMCTNGETCYDGYIIFQMVRNEKKINDTLTNEYTFTLKGLEEMEFELPIGVEYEVSVDTPSGWTKIEETNSTGIIIPNTINEAVFAHTK